MMPNRGRSSPWNDARRRRARTTLRGLRALAPVLVVACGTQSAPGAGVWEAAGAVDLAHYEIVDLTHAFDRNTIYWPTAPYHFEMDTLAWGETEGGWFYSAFLFRSPEHGGTHLDAPIHFARDGQAVDQVPLERLLGPAVVIDISHKAQEDRDYRLTVADVTAWERDHGPVPGGAIVLLRADWDRFWPDARTYLGTAERGQVAARNLHFPSYGAEAARVLVEERGAAALGADVASIDYGASTDFPVHRLIMGQNVPGLENLAHLDRLPPMGATVLALPMKIAGGSGAPVRVIALVPR